MSTENNAAPSHFGSIIPTLRNKTVGSCHAPGDETNLFLWGTELLSVWDMSTNEEQSWGREYKERSKIFFFPHKVALLKRDSLKI